MLTHRSHRLAGLVAAFAIALTAGSAAHHAAEPSRHTQTVVADPICPSGTNWNNRLQRCL